MAPHRHCLVGRIASSSAARHFQTRPDPTGLDVTHTRYAPDVTLERFTAPTREWFTSSFAAPTEAQTGGWEAIATGAHTLIHAPTGSGKTLAAFLWAIDSLASEPPPPPRERCRILYISPMKALAYDVERNLRAPLVGIQQAAARLDLDPVAITTGMRTGDTPSRDRQAMLRHPPDILITTPESLYLMLTSRAREILSPVRTVIVDEIHSVAGTKRGSHLALSLERLDEITDEPAQRIGLSATQRPLSRIGEFLGGGTVADDTWTPRPVTIVDAPRDKELDIQIVVPVADMTRPEETPPDVDELLPPDPPSRSIWPAMYPRLLDLVLEHRSTLLFVNSRGLAERLAAELNRLAGEELVQSHHGSVSREQRIEIEGRLKRGELRGVVATSTLELGIDMAAIALVLLVESPSSVARGLQRVGRAGHQVGAPSRARIFPKHRGDLLETAVVVDRMYAGAIESTAIPRNPLDVLAQHVVAMVATESRRASELFDLVRQATPYRELTRTAFDGVLDMLAGRYPSDDFAELRPRIVWDRVEDLLEPRGNARMLAVTNPGTIPDRGLYTVVLAEGGKVGELDEEMVYESRPGDTFVLGSTSWKISEIDHDRVVVVPAPAESAPRMPFWHGDGPGRPLELGRAVGAFVRELGTLDLAAATEMLESRYRLDSWAASNLARFIAEEREATGTLPTDRSIVVERFRDEIGDWRMVVLSPFGSRVHAPWALAARHRFREHGSDVDVIWTDDGMMFRFPDVDDPPPSTAVLVDPEEIDRLVLEEVGDSALFTSRFREAAARALLLPRRRPGSRTPLWLQRRRASDLLSVAKRYGSFPIVLETYREVLQDHFDLPALADVLGEIRDRRIRVTDVALDGPSPFASSLLFDFIASFMYEYDAPVAEKRAAALTLDRELLRDLLGDPHFRELLDADAVTEVELELQHLVDRRKVRSPDGVTDLLRDLGPLTVGDIAARSVEPDAVTGWLESLQTARRVVTVRVAAEERHAVVEDVARLRDALGVSPPPGIAESLLEPAIDPLGDIVGRYARTHGPFTAEDVNAAIGLPTAVVDEVLHRLETSGKVASGAYRPGGHGQEWVDLGVLRRLRRRSLAKLRSEIEAVEPESFAGFLPAWHGIGGGGSHRERLLEHLRRLQGTPLIASTLEREILPSRMDYSPSLLDELLATGEVVWVGLEPLGTKDGRMALYLRDHVPLLHRGPGDELPDGAIHEAVRGHLAERGATFFRDLYIAAGGGDPEETLAALWDLVWSGEVTNDTLAPLRAFTWGTRRSARRGPPAISASTPPAATGRWYLTAELVRTAVPPAPEQLGTALAEQLLERHGIVTRAAVAAEGVPGGFTALYPVLAAMEDAGRVRRGYFVEGAGGAQFALPGAVDRLRADATSEVVMLAATDPAQAYGALVPWPDHGAGKPTRRAGARCVLDGGRLVLHAEPGARRLLTFSEDTDLVVAAIELAVPHGATITTIDGEPALASPLRTALETAGFAVGYKGLTRRGTRSSARNRNRARG